MRSVSGAPPVPELGEASSSSPIEADMSIPEPSSSQRAVEAELALAGYEDHTPTTPDAERYFEAAQARAEELARDMAFSMGPDEDEELETRYAAAFARALLAHRSRSAEEAETFGDGEGSGASGRKQQLHASSSSASAALAEVLRNDLMDMDVDGALARASTSGMPALGASQQLEVVE